MTERLPGPVDFSYVLVYTQNKTDPEEKRNEDGGVDDGKPSSEERRTN